MTDIYTKIKAAEIMNNVKNDSFPQLKKAVRVKMLFNLTNYGATNSTARHATIKEAFKILKEIIGFNFNETGSFTSKGAVDAVKNDIDITENNSILQYVAKGKLEELELGKTNWRLLRGFFYNKGMRRKIQNKHPKEWRAFYNRLDRLFKKTRDPTMPEGRPYIEQAITFGAIQMGEIYMKKNIMKTFGDGGQWRTGAGRL